MGSKRDIDGVSVQPVTLKDREDGVGRAGNDLFRLDVGDTRMKINVGSASGTEQLLRAGQCEVAAQSDSDMHAIGKGLVAIRLDMVHEDNIGRDSAQLDRRDRPARLAA